MGEAWAHIALGLALTLDTGGGMYAGVHAGRKAYRTGRQLKREWKRHQEGAPAAIRKSLKQWARMMGPSDEPGATDIQESLTKWLQRK